MQSPGDVNTIRQHAILASLAGFPFLLVFGLVWLVAGALTYLLPASIAPWAYVFLGMPATPIAMWIEKRHGYLPAMNPDPLLPLTLQILFVQIVAFPAILLVWSSAPKYLPVAFAAIVGAHFLPFEWVYRTRLYRILGIVVAVGPYLIAVLSGPRSMHYTGFFVGTSLLIGAAFARRHARSTWIEYQRNVRTSDSNEDFLSRR